MKKIVLITAALCIGITGWAQKKEIQSAKNYLKEQDYAKAKDAIEKAIADPSTKDDPKAWATRAEVYLAMQQEPSMKNDANLKVAYESYMKVVELKPTYEKDVVNQNLLNIAYNSFNEGINAYNAREFAKAANALQTTLAVHSLEGGKRFGDQKSFDTVAANAKTIMAFSYFNDEKYDQALPLLLDLQKNPIGSKSDIYQFTAEIYKKQNKDAELLATLNEGKKLYPNVSYFRIEELNYYIKSGKQEELLKKLEDATVAEPKNGEILIQLANMYNSMAFADKKPANFDELVNKAEGSYNKALALDANNSDYNFNAGVLYYNYANKHINESINNINEKAPDAKKTYDDLVAKRNTYYDKAIGHFEKVVANIGAKSGKMNDNDKFYYSSSLDALSGIYVRQNKTDKAADVKKKIETYKANN